MNESKSAKYEMNEENDENSLKSLDITPYNDISMGGNLMKSLNAVLDRENQES